MIIGFHKIKILLEKSENDVSQVQKDEGNCIENGEEETGGRTHRQ